MSGNSRETHPIVVVAILFATLIGLAAWGYYLSNHGKFGASGGAGTAEARQRQEAARAAKLHRLLIPAGRVVCVCKGDAAMAELKTIQAAKDSAGFLRFVAAMKGVPVRAEDRVQVLTPGKSVSIVRIVGGDADGFTGQLENDYIGSELLEQ